MARERQRQPVRESPPKDILDRAPPCSIEAEKGVIGSALLLPESLDETILLLREDDFYDEANKLLWRHCVAIHNKRRLDTTLLVDALKRDGHYEAVGGLAYISEIIHAVPHAANARYYAELVSDKAVKRSLINASMETLRDAYDDSLDAAGLMDAAEQRVFNAQAKRVDLATASIQSVLQAALDRINSRKQGGDGLVTGYHDVDDKVRLRDGEFIIVAARPSVGKTSFSLNVTANLAQRGHGVLFVSLEMTAVQIADRMLAREAALDHHRMQGGWLDPEERKSLVECAAEMSQWNLHVDDAPTRSANEIAAIARRGVTQHGVELVIVDYLQLVRPDDERDRREEQVSKISKRLKALARELKVPVICLAQLNRQADGDRPRLSHLRESGSLEQDADIVVFLHRESPFGKKTPEERRRAESETLAIVAKNRNGATGEAVLLWDAPRQRFQSCAKDYQTQFADEAPCGPAGHATSAGASF